MELYIYGLLPIIIGLLILDKSIKLSLKYNGVENWFLTITIFISSFFAEFMLVMMFFFNAWPDFTAHVLLLLNVPLLCVQLFKYRNKNFKV